jgi:hypothetical protein
MTLTGRLTTARTLLSMTIVSSVMVGDLNVSNARVAIVLIGGTNVNKIDIKH